MTVHLVRVGELSAAEYGDVLEIRPRCVEHRGRDRRPAPSPGSAFQVALRQVHKALFGVELGRGIATTAVVAAGESPL